MMKEGKSPAEKFCLFVLNMKYGLPHLNNKSTAEFRENRKITTSSRGLMFEGMPLYRNRIY